MQRWLDPIPGRLQALRYWLVAAVTVGLLRLLRLFPADRVLAFAGWMARRIGPLSSRHRIALDNLERAMPELSAAQRQAIALDMWDNMARLLVEYVFLDWFDRFLERGMINERFEFVGMDRFLKTLDEPGPRIVFTAHLGNFELLPVAGARHGLPITALFRPPNNPYLARELARLRNQSGYGKVASRAGSSLALARVLEQGGTIGVLVDQKFPQGIRTTFFGRECGTNPLVPRLARKFDCPVIPSRCTRLPGNRFRIEFGEPLRLPRDATGSIDVAATAQMLNDVVEAWVREDPGQWTWFHRRWDMRPGRGGRRG
jgi:KDO2-lipid IV(A) lauroyltransferase